LIMILVTGATGTVGWALVEQLKAERQPLRILIRTVSRTADMSGVEAVQGDLSKFETLEPAFAGVEKVFLLTAMGPDLEQQEANALEAARRAGVQQVVKQSVLGAGGPNPESPHTSRHRASEQRIVASGLAWTFIRPSTFMSNALQWAGTIKSQGAVYLPAGEGKISSIHPRDIALVAAVALTRPEHAGKHYEISGPAALSIGEQVQAIARAIGKPLRFVDISPEVAGANMRKAGMPQERGEDALAFWAAVKAGRVASVTPILEQVTGTKPRSFEEWAQEHADAFR